ncbi:MAG: GIY-YIG nuclease family protein [Crocosphaera sp.]
MKVGITEIEKLPKVSGIYKVMNSQNKVIYIGQSKNIYKRWKNGHHKLAQIVSEYGTDIYIECVEIPEWLLNRVENTAISFYQPKLNSKLPPII